MTSAIWYVRTRDDGDSLLLTSTDPLSLRRSGGLPRLDLEASQRFRIIPDPRPEFAGEFKSQTLAYIYSIKATESEDDRDPEIVAWHWHPLTTPDRARPHIHVRAGHAGLPGLADEHIPSGRVSFEDVLIFLIEDLDVLPARDDWLDVVGESRHRFETFRTWA